MQLAVQADVDQARDMLDHARTESESLKARLRQVRGLAQSSAFRKTVGAKAGMNVCKSTLPANAVLLGSFDSSHKGSSHSVPLLSSGSSCIPSMASDLNCHSIVHTGRQQLERMQRQLRSRSFRTSLSPSSMPAGLQVRQSLGMLLECMVHRHARLCSRGSPARGLSAVSARLERKLAALSSPSLVHGRQASAARPQVPTASVCLANGCRLSVIVQTHTSLPSNTSHILSQVLLGVQMLLSWQLRGKQQPRHS